MPLDTEFLPKYPTIRLHRPSIRPSGSVHPIPRCLNSIQAVYYWHTDFPILNKLCMNGMAFEAVFFQQTFNFLLLIIPTTQLVRNSEVKVRVGRDERYLPFSVRHAGNFSVPDFSKNIITGKPMCQHSCVCTYSKY